MVYVVSLGIPAKKALPGKVVCSSIPKICGYLPLDPNVTGMDVVIVTKSDIIGPLEAQMNKALKNKHPGVCVIYIYMKDVDADRLDTPNKMLCKHIKDSVITDAVSKFVSVHIIETGKTQVTSKDFKVPKPNVQAAGGAKNNLSTGPIMEEAEEVKGEKINYVDAPLDKDEPGSDIPMNEPVKEVEPPKELDIPPLDTSAFDTKEEVPLEVHTAITNPLVDQVPAVKQNVPPIEDRLAGINNVEDWEIFKENLQRDSITEHLIEENTEYVGLINMLDTLDKQIEAVWRDSAYSPEQKFEKIKELGLQKSVHRAAVNSKNVDKAISIITTITMAASRTVEDKIKSIDLALYKVTTDKKAIMDTSAIDKAIERRTEVQLDLLNLARSIVDLYKSMNLLVNSEIASLDQQLPSSNEFINSMVKPIGVQIFTPTNTGALATKLLQALQENRLTASQLEDKVNNLIDLMFKLCESDEEIIRYQQNMINLLKAHRVEDVVIINSLLKDCLKLYIGPAESGVHATAITWCGTLSQRQNTLLIDLSGHSKFKEYGIQPMDLADFMQERVEKQFLCVESVKKLNTEELQKLVTELKSRLNYYPYVNIILDQDDAEGLDQLSADAKVVYYVTNCSSTSINMLSQIVKYPIVTNIARKLIMIDVPVNPLMIAERVDVDPTITQIITLPNIPQIRACTLNHDRTYEYSDVKAIFEEAFR